MKKFETILKKERELYRELFINSEKAFKDLLKKMKTDFSCSGCGVCCKVRYSRLSPSEIFYLANNEKDNISMEYMKFFVPYGVDKDFKYAADNQISIETNNKLAKSLQNVLCQSYVKNILSKHDEPVYFYFCKCLDEDFNCVAGEKSFLCKEFPVSITTILPKNCSYTHWQNLAVHKIENEIEPEINLKIREIVDYREEFKCNRTGTCCRLASSEFSYEELKEKALKNDEFAKQFTSIFVPYENIDEARKVFPEYVDLIESQTLEGEKINFFFCKHLEGKNCCPIYDTRPQICRDFPDNPITIIPPGCGYSKWKEEVIVAAHTFHGMTQIYKFYQDKIKHTLS